MVGLGLSFLWFRLFEIVGDGVSTTINFDIMYISSDIRILARVRLNILCPSEIRFDVVGSSRNDAQFLPTTRQIWLGLAQRRYLPDRDVRHN